MQTKTNTPTVSIEIFSPSSSDETLSLLKQYLTKHLFLLAESLPPAVSLVVDLGVLDGKRSPDERAQWYRKYQQENIFIYPLCMDRSKVIFGPLYHPLSGGPCPLCLEQAWITARKSELLEWDDVQQRLVFGRYSALTPFALEAVLAMLLAVCPADVLKRAQPQVSQLDLETLSAETYGFIPGASCPLCSVSKLDTRETAMLCLSSRPKKALSEYHLKAVSEYSFPETALVNPISGLLGTESYSNYTHTIDTCIYGRTVADDLRGARHITFANHGTSYQLRTAFLEGLERLAWARPTCQKTTVFDSYQNVQAEAVHPAEMGLYQPEIYHNSSIYTPFKEDLIIPWVWGYSFRKAGPILVPKSLAYVYRDNFPFVVSDTSSGCATGGAPEEAILFGLMELIERDGFLLSWYTKTAPRRVDLEHCNDRALQHMLDRYDRIGYDIHILDTRFDMQFPSVAAIAVLRDTHLTRPEDDPERIRPMFGVGGGASFSPEKAILSALAEVGFWVHNTRVDHHMHEILAMIQDYGKVRMVSDHALLYSVPETASKAAFLYQNPTLCPFDECYAEWLTNRPQSLDLRDDLLYCVKLILDKGMDVIAVDLTSPEQEHMGLKTFKVIVPGLLPIEFSGKRVRVHDLPRLKTAPRAAGYLSKDFDLANFNSDPHPFA
ncbi:TOMM precursor leader peptide-binding protein [Ktedonosporobacter rubrisoli]|nr:TOMM precursor leader peptide-binding protein [Ktedonosporobacter rubrisoli]